MNHRQVEFTLLLRVPPRSPETIEPDIQATENDIVPMRREVAG